MELPAPDDRDPARRGGAAASTATTLAHDIFATRFLLKRPLLQALAPDDGVAPVLLIDELDRTDEPFEAYLLEVLADFQVTIPELGADPRRGAADRRHHVEPHARDPRRDQAALPLSLGRLSRTRCASSRSSAASARSAPESLAREIVAFTQRLRAMDLFKAPGIAETLDWAEALIALDRVALDPQTVADTLGVLLKYQDDVGALGPDGRGEARRRGRRRRASAL